MYEDHTVGVVVPAYNEEGRVGEVLDDIPSFVDRVYVVDDASTDGTWEEIQRCTRAEADAERSATRTNGAGRIVPIRHEENRGAGGALKTGYCRARDDGLDVIVTIDGDGQMDPGMMHRFVAPIVEGRADYAKGDRLADIESFREMPPFRLVGNWMLTYLTRIASGYWTLSDPQNGYTAISNEALSAIRVEELYEYYGYCNELLVRLNVAGMRVLDVPMPSKYGDEESSIEYGPYIRKVSVMLFRNFLWRLRERYVSTRPHPAALAYGTGALTALLAVGTVVRTMAAAVGEGSEGEGGARRASMLALLAGVLAFLGAVLDKRANRDREGDR